MMRGHEKSDSVTVAAKPANKAEQSAAEPVEPRAGTKGNASQQSTCRTQSRVSVSQALEHIRRIAGERKKERFTALFHHLNIDLLEEAFYELKEDAAPGVDRLTWTDYEADLEQNLEDLHERVQRGAYRALPSRRVYIPKPDGRQRPLAVAALEDKIVQRAVLALLNAIYEEDFLGISYGFRPGRGTHDALDALCVGIDSRKVSWIVDADIRSFFDEISQEWLTRFLEHRIGDRRIIRLIQKWLKAGVLEAGAVSVSDKGTGQGSVMSPLLAKIYLHYAVNLWAVRWRRREATATWSSCAMPTTSSSDSSTKLTPDASWMRCVSGCGSLRCRFILRRPGSSSSDALRRNAASGAGSANRRPSTSWASPSSAAKPTPANSRSNGRAGATACWRSYGWSKRRCEGACTSLSRFKGSGFGMSCAATSITTRCRRTVERSWHSGPRSPKAGIR